MGGPDYQLFTSLRYDPVLRNAAFNTAVNRGEESPFLLFPYHYDRLTKAARVFGWPSAIKAMSEPDAEEKLRRKCEEAVTNYPHNDKENGLRVRVPFSVCVLF